MLDLFIVCENIHVSFEYFVKIVVTHKIS